MLSKTKRSFLKSKVSSKLDRTNRTLRILILVMGVIVIYDSFIHLTPLYYVLFFVLGRIAGIAFRLVFWIEKPQEKIFEIRTNRWNILLTLVLLFLHFLGGQFLLESINIVWVKDALYLFFIGLYLTKLKIIIKQIDEYIYASLLKKGTYK